MPSKHQVMRRPPKGVTAAELQTYQRTLARALETLGVRNGEDYVVIPARLFFPSTKPGEVVPAKARSDDKAASQRAKFHEMPRKGTQRLKALMAIRDTAERGATYAELAAATGVSGIWKRLSELEEGGWIMDSGRQRLVPDTGAHATVWVLTDRGKDQLK